jgi:hypothetical protein
MPRRERAQVGHDGGQQLTIGALIADLRLSHPGRPFSVAPRQDILTATPGVVFIVRDQLAASLPRREPRRMIERSV